MKELEKRADNVKNVDPSVDNMLKITSDGRKISYTQRMIDPSLPYEEGCKIYRCADNVVKAYEESADIKGTQQAAVYTIGANDSAIKKDAETGEISSTANGATSFNYASNNELIETNEDGKVTVFVYYMNAMPADGSDNGVNADGTVNSSAVLTYRERDNVADGKWNWTPALGEEGAAGYGSGWNFYTTQIDGIWYNVYVVTYETVLNGGETTAENAIHKVYMDHGVTSEKLVELNEALGGDWSIKVVAEGVQAASFTNAYEALNAAFGVPGTYTINWPEYGE
jgi:hypothetical protein